MTGSILLTGGTGFLGSNLLRRLVLEKTAPVVVLKRTTSNLWRIQDLFSQVRFYDLDLNPLSDIFKQNKINQIIHCATSYGRHKTPPLEIIEANLMLPLRLLELGVDFGVTSFINTDTILDKRVNHYSLSKKQFLEWMTSMETNLVCINVAIEHFYGPLDDISKFSTKVITDLLNQVETISFTPGEQKRDFIFLDDVVDAFMHIINFSNQTKPGGYRFEVGTDHKVKIRDFVHLAKKLTGNLKTHLNFGALPYRQNEVMESRVDLTNLLKLGWTPKTNLEDGLMKTIEQERSRLKK